MEPVIYPTIRILPPERWEPLDTALHHLAEGAYDWLVLTSANGVRYVWERLEALGLSVPNTVQVAVIGPATARALAAKGYVPTVMPETYVAEALADALGDVTGQRILLARADRARPTLRPVEVIAFTSPSTVEGFVRALGKQHLSPATRVVCIGPITAQAARAAGLSVHAEADR